MTLYSEGRLTYTIGPWLVVLILLGSIQYAYAQQVAKTFLSKTELRFEENKGQIADSRGEVQKDILYTMRGDGITLFFRRDGISYQWHYTEKILDGPLSISESTGRPTEEENSLHGKSHKPDSSVLHTFRMDMFWTNPSNKVEINHEDASEDYNNYYLTDNSLGVTGVRSYRKLIYKNLYPNIDVIYYLLDDHLKYDIIVRKNGELQNVSFRYDGVTPRAENDKVRVETPLGFLEEQAPIAFYGSGKRVDINYIIKNDGVSFRAKDKLLNTEEALIIDPQLLWGTYYGGPSTNVNEVQGTQTIAAATDANNNVYITGLTDTSTGIASAGLQNIYGGSTSDAFLVKFNNLGGRQWATYYGGSGADQGRGVDTDSGGNIYLTGFTTSASGIALGGYQNTLAGESDAFLAKITSSGSLVWGTYYGGPGTDYGYSVKVDPSDNVVISGWTFSTTGIAFNASQSTLAGSYDVYLAKFSPLGSLSWATYFGGPGDDHIDYSGALDINQFADIYVAGSTTSVSGIATNAFQSSTGGSYDAFLAKFNSAGTVQWSTYYGGSADDAGSAVSVDANNDVYIAGGTYSTAGISFNGYQNSIGGNLDGYLAKFSGAGTRLWSTYYGGLAQDNLVAVTTYGSQYVYVTGMTYSQNGIAAGGLQNSLIGAYNSPIVKFDGSGAFQWGTYYGGSNNSSATICLDPSGNIYFGGYTTATSGIAFNGFQNSYPGLSSGFLAKLNDIVVMPTTQSTNISFVTRTSSSITLNVTNGDAVSRLIIAKSGSPVDSDPINGISYIPNSTFGMGAQLGSGNFAVASGSGPFTVSGLNAATQYFFRVYEFNGSGGTEIYNTTTATGNPASASSLALKPLSQASIVNVSSPTTSTLTLNISNGNGTSRLVLARMGSPVNANPIDGVSYTVNTSQGLGSQVGSGNFVVGSGNGPVTVSGLIAGTTYYFSIYEFNGSGGTESYDFDAIIGSTISAPTISNPPTTITPTLIQGTSFQANWLASTGATDYRLDVSSDNFATYVTGFNNLTVGGTSQLVTGLSSGTIYQYRVRASNSSGVSGNSNVSQALTFPSNVVANAASSVTQSGFTSSWSAVTGVTNYQLDVSNDNFATFLTGYNSLLVANTSQPVTGLQSGTQYQYRVRATNTSGPGSNSNTVSVVTIPGNPVATVYSSLSQSGFTANWNSVTGATGYFLDISTDNFSTFVSGFNNLAVSGTSIAVTGLSPAATYQYRVRATNSSGDSGSSNPISVLTIPANPVIAITANSVAQDGFILTWSAVAGADSYNLEISSSSAFTVNDPQYNGLSVIGTSKTITGLASGQVFYARLSSKNTSGVSGASNVVSQLLIPANPVLNDATLVGTTSFKFSWTALIGADKYLLEVSSDDFVSLIPGYGPKTILTGVEDFVTGLTPNTVYKYRAKAQNASGLSNYSNVKSVQTLPTGSGNNSVSHDIPCPTGGEVKDYRIISIPQLQSTELSTTLTDATYEKNWRIMHWTDHTGDVKDIHQMVPGQGYWINSNFGQRPNITVKGIDAPQAFTLNLQPGWNQIGNPFTFDVSWSDVLAQNPSVSNIGPLYTYNDPSESASSPFATYDGLLAYKGGFVNNMNNGNVSLIIPTTVKHFGGRVGSFQPTIETSDLGGSEWFVPLSLTVGDLTNQLGGFGMHPNADWSLDKWDAINLPHFFSYIDLNTNHPEFFQPSFMRDVVPTLDKFDWAFTATTNNISDTALLTWKSSDLGKNAARLYLFDPQIKLLVDMKKVDSYSFQIKNSYSLKFFYSKDGFISPDISDVLQPYPNPFSKTVTIPFITNEPSVNIEVTLLDAVGKPVRSIQTGILTPGYHEVIWDGNDGSGTKASPGVYLYKITGMANSRNGKIVFK